MDFLFFISVAFGVVAWGAWYKDLLFVGHVPSKRRERIILAVFPLICSGAIALVLAVASSQDVQWDLQYLVPYSISMIGCLGAINWIFNQIGMSARDDILERGNLSALWTVMGIMLGITCCLAGANIGNGPGPEAVVFSVVLSVGGFFVAWFAYAGFIDRSFMDRISIDRDAATAQRSFGLTVALGLVLGFAIAGDWTSWQHTVLDFARWGFPAIILIAVAGTIERSLRRPPDAPANAPAGSPMIAGAYIASAVLYLFVAGHYA